MVAVGTAMAFLVMGLVGIGVGLTAAAMLRYFEFVEGKSGLYVSIVLVAAVFVGLVLHPATADPAVQRVLHPILGVVLAVFLGFCSALIADAVGLVGGIDRARRAGWIATGVWLAAFLGLWILT